MKFLHVADAHLDSPFGGLSILEHQQIQSFKDSTQHAFSKMVDFALENKVDFILLVGDIFDSPNPTPRSQSFLMNQLARLTESKIHVYLSFGNHDFMIPEKLLIKSSDYLHLFDQEVETFNLTTKDQTQVDITGFSYTTNHIQDDIVSTYPAKIPGHYTIGTLHAGEKTTEANQNNYAPFSIAELRDKNYDYFALGHIHKRQTLSEKPLVVYPGNLQGRNINEDGQKGFYEVEVNTDHETNLNFIPTSDFIWQRISLKLDNEVSELTKATLVDQIINAINQVLSQNQIKTLIELDIQNAQVLNSELQELLNDSEFLLGLSQSLELGSLIVRLKLLTSETIVLSKTDQQYFDDAAENIFTTDKISELTKFLTKEGIIENEYFDDSNFLADLKLQTELSLKKDYEVEE